MRPSKLVTTLLATVAFGALCASPAGAASCSGADLRPASGNLDVMRAATLCLLNDERAAAGLDPLTENARLTTASNEYSQEMVSRHFFAHVGPDGQTLVERLTDVGYLGHSADWLAGENIAWAEGRLSTPEQVMQAWMQSPGHRENILEPRFREVGLGVALGAPDDASANGATYTTDFGMVDADTASSSSPSAGKDSPRTVAVTPSRRSKRVVKRTCRSGKRLVVVRRKGKRIRRCVSKRKHVTRSARKR
jgi:uncharacterized protein YkwD